MKVDADVVATMAELAKLKHAPAEVEAYQQSMSSILDLVEEMQAVDTSGIEPLAHPLETTQRLRPDEVTETDNRVRYQAIAPDVAEGLYLVPKVIE